MVKITYSIIDELEQKVSSYAESLSDRPGCDMRYAIDTSIFIRMLGDSGFCVNNGQDMYVAKKMSKNSYSYYLRSLIQGRIK